MQINIKYLLVSQNWKELDDIIYPKTNKNEDSAVISYRVLNAGYVCHLSIFKKINYFFLNFKKLNDVFEQQPILDLISY